MTIIKFIPTRKEIPSFQKEIPGANCYHIELSVLLDGIQYYNYLVNIESIAEFLNPNKSEYREYSFWTCSCGVLGCLGLSEMTVLKDDENELKTLFQTPSGTTKLINIQKDQLKDALLELINDINLIEEETPGYCIGIDIDSEKTSFPLFDLKSFIKYQVENYSKNRKSTFKI